MSKKNFLQAMHGWQEKTIRREFDFVCVPCMEASLPLPTSGPYYANSPRGVMRNVWKKRLAFVSGNERGRRRSSSDQVTMRECVVMGRRFILYMWMGIAIYLFKPAVQIK